MNLERKRIHEKLAKIDALMEACPELDLINYQISNLDAIVGTPLLVFHKETSDHAKVAALIGGRADDWEYPPGSKEGAISMTQTVNGVVIELHNAHMSPILNHEIDVSEFAATKFTPAP